MAGAYVLFLSALEAITLKQDYLGAEHLLVGITRFPGGLRRRLSEVGLDRSNLHDRLLRDIGQRPTRTLMLKVSPSFRESLRLARGACTRNFRSKLGPIDLLSGVLEFDQGWTARVIEPLTPDIVRRAADGKG